MTPKIVCVVPTCRAECHAKFVAAWGPLFEKHSVTLITVWDGENPTVTHDDHFDGGIHDGLDDVFDFYPSLYPGATRDLFCTRTDACRNLGFVSAAVLNPDYVLTLDDDCYPAEFETTPRYWEGQPDPIQSHVDALSRRVPLSWTNTAHDTDLYLRGVPYGVRDEAPVMLSHGVWVGVPDFDGETQLRLTEPQTPTNPGGAGIPHSLPYYVGPVPRGVLFPLCGMNVMVRREALPYLYYAPMGADSGVPDLHRFADIFMGVFLKRAFDALGWACVTGYSTVLHSRASDARKNFEAEKLGREWMELLSKELGWDQVLPPETDRYIASYADKRGRYAELIRSLLPKTDPNAEEYRK